MTQNNSPCSTIAPESPTTKVGLEAIQEMARRQEEMLLLHGAAAASVEQQQQQQQQQRPGRFPLELATPPASRRENGGGNASDGRGLRRFGSFR